MLRRASQQPSENPNQIAENEEFEITYLSDSSSTQKKVKYKKIHTLGVSSLCGLATIAEYIIRRPFSERMAIYKNILKYAHRKNPGDFFVRADSPDSPNIELKLDTIYPRYFQLIEKFQEARNESFKKFIKDKINAIKPESSSAVGVSDSVAVSLLARQFKETSDHQLQMITESLDQLDQADAELYQSTYQKVFSNSDGSVDVIAFDEFKKLFQVKSISEIFYFARNRAIKLGRQEVIDSQTVTFFTAYFENDNSCQLWIINLLQNYEHEINKSLTDVLKIEEDDEINQNEDYSTNHLDLFFKLAINKAIDEMLPFNCFEVHDSEDLTQQRYKRRILNITKQDNVFSISSQIHHDPNIDYDISCFFTGGSRSAGAGHYSYCQKEGEKKFPEPILEDSAEIVAKEELTLPALDAAELSAQDPATAWVRFASGDSATAWVRFASGESVAASGDAQAGRRQGWSGGGEESLRRRSVDPELRTRRRDAIDPTYDYTHQFQQVATTGYNLYCGYGSIANYVKFLSVDERMAFYKKLFADADDNHDDNRLQIFDDQGNITEQSQAELLILEKLLKFREEKFNEFVNPRNAHLDELGYFESITKECCRKYGITNVKNFFEDFKNKYKIITPYRDSFRECGPHYYQTWMAQFLKNKLMQINPQLQSDLARILSDESHDQSDQISLKQNNLYEDQRTKLFQFYFKNKASARISRSIDGSIRITNPEIENKELVWFHRALIEKRDEVGATEDQKLFYQLYDHFLKKYIPRGGHENVVEYSNPVPYQHFYTKENYETFLQTAVDIETISSDLNDGNDRPDLSTEIAMAIKSNVANVEYFLIKIAEHFRREFSFEKQFVNLLHSDTFFTEAYPGHYTTMIPTYKAKNPFPDKDSNLDIEAQLQSDDQQLIIQKQNVEEAFKSSQIASGNIDLQFSLRYQPLPTLINSYHSISFTRLYGRQNNNYSYVDVNREGQSKSPFSKINSIIEKLKNEIDLEEGDLAMAIFLSKKFGGIGTKSKKIFNYYRENNTKVKDYLENNNSEIFKKMINFSYRFQKECRDQGIYSGNERLADDKKKEFGLRLSFIPDEIFRIHLNKLPTDSEEKKIIIGEIKQSQDTHVAR